MIALTQIPMAKRRIWATLSILPIVASIFVLAFVFFAFETQKAVTKQHAQTAQQLLDTTATADAALYPLLPHQNAFVAPNAAAQDIKAYLTHLIKSHVAVSRLRNALYSMEGTQSQTIIQNREIATELTTLLNRTQKHLKALKENNTAETRLDIAISTQAMGSRISMIQHSATKMHTISQARMEDYIISQRYVGIGAFGLLIVLSLLASWVWLTGQIKKQGQETRTYQPQGTRFILRVISLAPGVLPHPAAQATK